MSSILRELEVDDNIRIRPIVVKDAGRIFEILEADGDIREVKHE